MNWKQPRLLIAEVGSVPDGSFGNACKLIEAAAGAGAGAVKFQTHLAEAETLRGAPSPSYFQAEPRWDYFRRTAFSAAQHKELFRVASDCGVLFLSSPFSIEAVDLLEEVGVEAYKIPSGEITNLPLLRRVAATGKPTLLSSGMSSWAELDRAVACLRDAAPLIPMQCSSVYPCPPERVGLNVLGLMSARYGLPVGFSDHTLGPAAVLAAAALGAGVIEKHFAFSRLMYGSDARHSMEPAEFAQMAAALREVWRMLESPVEKDEVAPYLEMKAIFEKSLVTVRAVPGGRPLAREDLGFKKPGTGIPSAEIESVLGRRTRRDLPADILLRREDLE